MLFFFYTMIYLLATIISSTSIFVIFRLAKNFNCRITPLITINYFIATIFGFGFFMRFDFRLPGYSDSWLLTGIILGTLFIGMFYLIGISSQKAGITVTTLANKLSLVFPVFFSIIWFNEETSASKYIGFFASLIAMFLTIYKKEVKRTNIIWFFLPVIIFIGSGITDSVVKYAQAVKIQPFESGAFSTFVFLTAFLLSAIATLFNKNTRVIVHRPTLLMGVLLGLVNFGSLYFIINALNHSLLKSSVVFVVINMSIVILSAIIGRTFFKEKLSLINVSGIILAILSLLLLL